MTFFDKLILLAIGAAAVLVWVVVEGIGVALLESTVGKLRKDKNNASQEKTAISDRTMLGLALSWNFPPLLVIASWLFFDVEIWKDFRGQAI